MSETKLFSTLTLRGITLKNRIVASPMWQYSGIEGFPTDWHLMHLGRLADGGAGLVFQEGTTVERRGCGTVGDLGIWDDQYVEPLTRIVALARANGTVPGIQLMHAGRKARTKPPTEGRGPLLRSDAIPDWDNWHPVAPSAIPLKEGMEAPRGLTLSEVGDVIDAFVSATRRARQAGYDVLEIHGAHGYLIHEFLSPLVNQRTDRYGGSFHNRIRFLTELVEGVRAVWDRNKPVLVRLSCIDNAGWEIGDTVALARVLKKLGVDAIDCTSGGLIGSPLPNGAVADYGYQVHYAAQVRREADIATVAVGLIVHAAHAEQILQEGSADLVAIGRELIYNPAWPIDAAQKLGADPSFSQIPERAAFWLRGRAAAKPDLKPSTFSH
jgi:2,4-dienoyl-CoA reductase-like NADH-dependent reductase (Old Yellow Enzyme family)